MKKMRIWLIAVCLLSVPSGVFAEEVIKGHYCYACEGNENLNEARTLTRTLAVRDAIESAKTFFEPTACLKDFKVTNDIIQIIISGYLKDVRVLEHTEKDHQVCETIEAKISPEEVGRVIRQALSKRRKKIEDLGIDNNGCLKILEMKRLEDRYGQRIDVVVKVLRHTGSLATTAHRNRKSCFKILIDFYDAHGVPTGGDSRYVHESSKSAIPGEIRTITFYAPTKVQSYRVWLKSRRVKTKKTVKKDPPVRPEAAGKAAGEAALETAADQGSIRENKAFRHLKGLEPNTTEKGFQLNILADGPIVDYNNFFMDSPPRLVIDLEGRWKTPTYNALEVEGDTVERIRIGKHRGKLRLVMDLKDKGERYPAVIQESSEGLTVTIKRK